MYGFKSFPDKTKLSFDNGLTAVVGPNGSGKSNIGDAVRWVLGEQSTKNLRGAKMEDVIFAGTEKRRPVGCASVTLCIDNSSAKLKYPGEEICVTRRLWRSGESEYLINGKQVRLREINELFMDTGLGRDGYAIIGQGRIAEIVGAKSGERRDIFEEAAGISRFRYKRNEATRKLQASEESILRMRDIIAELEARLEPLKIQAEKAERYLWLAEKRRALELSVWLDKLDVLKEKLRETDDNILICTAQYENLELESEALERKISENYQEMQKCSAEADRLRNEIIAAEQEFSDIRSAIAVLENNIVHCEEAIQTMTAEVEGKLSSRAELFAGIKEQKKRLEDIDGRLAQSGILLGDTEAALRAASEDERALGESLGSAGDKLNLLYISRSELTHAVAAAKTAIASLTAEISRFAERSAEAEERQRDCAAQLEENEKALKNALERQEEQSNRIAGLNRVLSSRMEKLVKMQGEQQSVSLIYGEKNQKLKLLRDLESNMEGFQYSVKDIIKASKSGAISGIHGTVSQIIRVEAEYGLAVETALGAAMQNIVVENEETAKRCIRRLTENKSGRATFLPLTSVRGTALVQNGLESEDGFVALASRLAAHDAAYSGVVNSLLGRTAVAEDLDCAARIAKKYGYKFRIVTLDGQIINAGGSFTGGSSARSAGILTRRAEIRELEEQTAEMEERRKTLASKCAALKAETDKMGFDIEGAKALLSDIRADSTRLEAEKSGLLSLLEVARRQAVEIISSGEKAEADIKKQEIILKDTQEALDGCEKSIEAAQENMSGDKTRQEELKRRRESLSEKLSELRIQGAELVKDREAAEKEIISLENAAGELALARERTLSAIKEKKREIETLHEEIAVRRQGIEGGQTRIAKMQELIKRQQGVRMELEHLSGELREEEKRISAEKERYTREGSRLEERRSALQKESDGIVTQMWEQYEITRSEAEKIGGRPENMAAAQRELNEIRGKIKALGSVNVDAIEEYKEVSQRYGFLDAQMRDVESAKRELEKLIADLTENMRRVFSENFAQINENFNEVFRALFGGGSASLVLADPENVLESGIEIVAAPPGKTIKNLMLFSGGEQAFIAISIYFAILKLRPSPFCILDEIDAALDEVNVRKYASYIRNFKGGTQFILVTHKRGAMEAADTLYGVTMQEDGVSRLLKMNTPDNPPQEQHIQ